MTHKKNQSGFSLVEIMVTVAIIGILASIAIPSYTNYIKRAQITEALEFAELAKIHMIDYRSKNGKFVTNYGNWSQRNTDIGLESITSYKTKYIKQMWVGNDGIIALGSEKSAHIAFSLNSDIFGSKNFLLLTIAATGGGRYKTYCADLGAKWKTNIDQKYLPSSCQNIDSSK